MRRLLFVVAGFAAAMLIVAAPSAQVSAHADLVRAEPAPDSKVPLSPSQLILHFSQGVKEDGSFIQVEDSDGNRLAVDVSFDPSDPKVMVARPATPLGPGVYKVHWQTLSADDDDFHDGDYQLIILNPDGSDPEGVSSSVGAENDDGGSGDTLILIAVVVAVVIGIGGLGYYLRTSNARAAK